VTFNVTHTFAAGTIGVASQLNQNFNDIEDELNSFPTDGAIKAASIPGTAIANDAIGTANLDFISTAEPADDDTIVPTAKAVKDYVDKAVYGATVSMNENGGSAWTQRTLTTRGGIVPVNDQIIINQDGDYIIRGTCCARFNGSGGNQGALMRMRRVDRGSEGGDVTLNQVNANTSGRTTSSFTYRYYESGQNTVSLLAGDALYVESYTYSGQFDADSTYCITKVRV
jgi:hypothetical protein